MIGGVSVASDNIVLGIPEISLPLVDLRTLLPLFFQSGHAFHFLIAGARCPGALTPDEETGANEQADELKVLHKK